LSRVLTFFKVWIFILVFLLIGCSTNAQKIEGIPVFFASNGFIMPHHRYMSYLIKGHVFSANFEWFNRDGFSHNHKYWQLAYKHPFVGWGLYYANLGNPEQLGNVLALYKKIQVPLLSSKHIYYQINGGVSYLTKTFEVDANYFNTVIGSHVNVFFKMGIVAQKTIGKRFVLFSDLNFSHFSNGNYYEPNAGINVVSLGLGLRLNQTINNDSSVIDKIIDKDFSKYAAEILINGGVKSIPHLIKKNFFDASMMLNAIYRPNFKNAFDAGLDGFYDRSVKTTMIIMEKLGYDTGYLYRVGIHVGYEPQFGKTAIAVQMGMYFFDKLNAEGPFYHRVAIKQYLSNRFLLSVAIKTHFFKAEFVEWGVGYNLHLSKSSKL